METTFNSDSRVGRLWNDIQGELKPPEKEVNVGSIQDPLTMRQFKNLTNKMETGEVLEWCYGHRDCHPLLRKHGFPIFFSMDDGDPNRWFDDQKRFEISQGIGALKNKPPRTGKETAKRFFDWSLRSFQFQKDCPLEATAWQAALANCGQCSEGTSILYHLYTEAGFKPIFYFEQDWEPGMRWIKRLRAGEESFLQDHVLLGIPVEKGEIIFADRINEEWDGKHPQAVPLTPASYSALMLFNLSEDAVSKGNPGLALSQMRLAKEMLPLDPYIHFMVAAALKRSGDPEGEQMLSTALQIFPGDPFVETLHTIITNNPFFLLMNLKNRSSPLAQQLTTLEEKEPRLAAKAYHLLGEILWGALKAGKNKYSGMEKGLKNEFESLALVDLQCFALALRANPNDIKSFLRMAKLLEEFGGTLPDLPRQAIKTIDTLLETHPEHIPLRFLAGEAYASFSNEESLQKALAHFEWVDTREPNNPIVTLRMALVYGVSEKLPQMIQTLNRVKQLTPNKLPAEYYQLLMSYYIKEGKKEEALQTLRELLNEKSFDGLDLILKHLCNTIIYPLEGSFPGTHVFLETRQNPFQLTLGALMVELEKYPRAQPKLEELRARQIVLLALIDETADFQTAYAKISEPTRPENMAAFRKGIEEMDKWLTRNFQREEVTDWVFQKMELIQKTLPPGLEREFVSVYVELVNNYIWLGKYDRASTVLKRMMATNTTHAVIYYANRVIEMRYPTLEHHFHALDILFDEREKIAPEVLARLKVAYENLKARLNLTSHKYITVQQRITKLNRGK